MPNLTLDQYVDWHKEKSGEDLKDVAFGKSFAVNTGNLLTSVGLHVFFQDIQAALAGLEGDGLLAENQASSFQLFKKGYPSVVNKIYRRNCHWNRFWPDKPKGGWVKFDDVYEKFDDIIRCTLVSRYLDGGEAIGKRLEEIGHLHSVEVAVSPRATDQGHYAWHAYVTTDQDVFIAGDVCSVPLRCEIQIVTLLQSVLKGLTHQFYEKSRIADTAKPADRRWQFHSPEFKGEFLGHTLHLVDSMLVELRDEPIESEVSGEVCDGAEEGVKK